MAEEKIGAFVDFDGTLLNGYLWRAMINHHRTQRFNRMALNKFLAIHIPLIPLWRRKLISRDWFYRIWGENMAWFLKGVTTERGEQVWQWLMDHEIGSNFRPEMIERIRDHKMGGHAVILLSGAYEQLLRIVADSVGAQDVLATPLEVRNGRYTGKVVRPLNIGKYKRELMTKYAQKQGIDLNKSYCYTDSIVDLPALEIVGFPVAVYPDEVLEALARKNGWQVID